MCVRVERYKETSRAYALHGTVAKWLRQNPAKV